MGLVLWPWRFASSFARYIAYGTDVDMAFRCARFVATHWDDL
jgi:hypothetical protein